MLSIELLKTFSEKELDCFFKFIDSTYFNSNKNLCRLFKLLRRYALNIEGFEDEVQLKIYRAVSGKASQQICLNQAQKKELNRQMNNLLVLAEDYLVAERIKNQKDKKYALLFPELIERKQIVLYNRRLKTLQKKMETEKNRDTDYYTKQYELQYYQANILYIENKMAQEDNFDELQYHLDIKYLLEKLNFHLAKITLLNAYATKKFDLSPFNAIDSLLKLPQYSKNPLIHLSLLNIDLVKKEDDDTFIALSKAIIGHDGIVPTSFLKPFYTNLANYCGKQLIKGRLSFYTDLFNIYKNMDEANLLIMDDALDVGLLKNIITNACRVKEFAWAKRVLERYKIYINEKVRSNVFNYNYGIICFNEQKYMEALSYFSEVKKIDETHEIGIKVTTLKCFYETDLRYENSTQQAIDSRMIFFRKNQKLPLTIRNAYINFINLFNRLYKLKQPLDKTTRILKIEKALPLIKNKLNDKTLIQEKQWLLTKIKALENECK